MEIPSRPTPFWEWRRWQVFGDNGEWRRRRRLRQRMITKTTSTTHFPNPNRKHFSWGCPKTLFSTQDPKWLKEMTPYRIKKLEMTCYFCMDRKKHTMEEDVFDQMFEALHQSDTPATTPPNKHTMATRRNIQQKTPWPQTILVNTTNKN